VVLVWFSKGDQIRFVPSDAQPKVVRHHRRVPGVPGVCRGVCVGGGGGPPATVRRCSATRRTTLLPSSPPRSSRLHLIRTASSATLTSLRTVVTPLQRRPRLATRAATSP
jgi:hypothetical protein